MFHYTTREFGYDDTKMTDVVYHTCLHHTPGNSAMQVPTQTTTQQIMQLIIQYYKLATVLYKVSLLKLIDYSPCSQSFAVTTMWYQLAFVSISLLLCCFTAADDLPEQITGKTGKTAMLVVM